MAEMQEGPVEIELSKPIKIDGAEVKKLRMREPLLGDQYASQKRNGDEADQELAFVADLCQVTPDDLKKLTLRDYKKVQKALLGFIG